MLKPFHVRDLSASLARAIYRLQIQAFIAGERRFTQVFTYILILNKHFSRQIKQIYVIRFCFLRGEIPILCLRTGWAENMV